MIRTSRMISPGNLSPKDCHLINSLPGKCLADGEFYPEHDHTDHPQHLFSCLARPPKWKLRQRRGNSRQASRLCRLRIKVAATETFWFWAVISTETCLDLPCIYLENNLKTRVPVKKSVEKKCQ